MKKTLLLATAMMAAASAFALPTTDPATYADVEDLQCQNLWIYSRFTNNWTSGWGAVMADNMDRARTATITEDKVYVGYSLKTPDAEGNLNDGTAHILVYDLYSGEYEKQLQCTYNGAPITGLLCANQIGTDDFGHIWFAGYRARLFNAETNVASPIVVYYVKDWETGECEKAFEVTLPESEAESTARTDYYDLVGDVTGQEAKTVFMSVGCEGATMPWIYGWIREQGQEEFGPYMCDGEYVAAYPDETYPDGQTLWNYGSTVYICRDEDMSASLFYVDGFTTSPTLYDTAGTMIDGFKNAPDFDQKGKGANGIVEFHIDGRDFIAYPIGQYDAGYNCQINVCQLGEGMAFEGMKLYWSLPEAGLGDVSDGGLRIHSLKVCPLKDDNGKEAVYLMGYKANNGLYAYRIQQPGFNDPHGGIQGVQVDNSNAPVEYFNIQGVRVNADNLTNGVYVKRQGSKAEKVFVK